MYHIEKQSVFGKDLIEKLEPNISAATWSIRRGEAHSGCWTTVLLAACAAGTFSERPAQLC